MCCIANATGLVPDKPGMHGPDCSLEELKSRVKKLRVIFPATPPADLHLTDIIKCQTTGREIVITVANWNQHKQLFLNTYTPESCTEIPMSLEDIFIECPDLRRHKA